MRKINPAIVASVGAEGPFDFPIHGESVMQEFKIPGAKNKSFLLVMSCATGGDGLQRLTATIMMGPRRRLERKK